MGSPRHAESLPPPSRYSPPSWRSMPDKDIPLRLEVLKTGTLLDEIDLTTKSFFIVGRQSDVCHIFTEHPTISRQHAVIQHAGKGKVFIYDLKSTHGTMVNMKRIPAERFYLLDGPDHLRPPETLDFVKRFVNPPESSEVQAGDVTMAIEPVPQEESSIDSKLELLAKSNPDDDSRVEDAGKILNELKGKRDQRKDLERELQKLRDKRKDETDALTDSEIRYLEHCEAQLQKLEIELETCVQQAEELLSSESTFTPMSRKRKLELEAGSDEEDAFYDRTIRETTIAENSALTESKVRSVLKDLDDRKRKLEALIAEKATGGEMESRPSSDSLDAYMVSLEVQERTTEIDKLKQQLKAVEDSRILHLQYLERLKPSSALASPAVRTTAASSSGSAHATPRSVPGAGGTPVSLSLRAVQNTRSPVPRRSVVRHPKEESDDSNSNSPQPARATSSDTSNSQADADWQPPSGQSGDGRTSLNDKLGY